MKSSALLSVLLPAFASVARAAIGSTPCVSFDSKGNGFPVYANGKAAPILTDPKDSYSVHRAVGDFVKDIKAVTSSTPKASNYTSASSVSKGSTPIIIGTVDSPWIKTIVAATKFNVSGIEGQWEAFTGGVVSNPLPNVAKAYLLVGSDRRGTVYGIYEFSEQFGVSPWYWWADVPIQRHSSLYALSCSHGAPSVKYRGIFLNDEQPALQNWAQEKYAANATAAPFNHFFYAQLFELLLRMRVNYLWPAIWAGMFAVDDTLNQGIAEYYGIVMGTSHQEPMMRSTPNEFNKFYPGQAWDWFVNKANISQYFTEGAERAKPYESLYTVGMRGSGDEPLIASTNVPLLEDIISTQRTILGQVYNTSDVSKIPQMWCLYKEVQGYYESGMTVPDDITLLWVDDNWGNIRRFPIESERNRTGGAGVYYHVDYVGSPRDYKWITSTQLSKMYDQMSTAYDRGAETIWILNVGDLKPYEMATEFFITLGWDRAKWSPDTVDSFVEQWATREFNVPAKSPLIAEVVANVTRFNARRKPELWNTTTYSLTDYREADNEIAGWKATFDTSTSIYNSLPSATKSAYYELVHHAATASYNLAQLYVTVGKNNLFASQARISTNDLADTAETLFENDWTINNQYNTMLNGKWDHMMDQTHIGYYYWQQPMTNTMPAVNRVQKNFQALPGPMRITIEGLAGAWPGDNPNQCAQGYNCPPPTLRTFDSYQPYPYRYIDISAGGPNSFSWTVAPSAPWIKVSSTSGSISRSQPEDRIEVSVDWSKVNNATVAGSVVITSKPTKTCLGCTNSLTIFVNANKTSVTSGFHGHVEGDGSVSIEAPHSSSNTTVSGVTWTTLPNFGKTVGGIKPLPVLGNNGGNFSIGAGPSISYDFFTFNPVSTMTSYIAIGFNAYGNDRPLKFAVQIDSESPQAIQYVPAVAVAGNLPPQWDTPDGWAANSVITATTNHTDIGPGAHTLKVWMVEPAVVLEKFVINTGGVRPSYLGPPESVIV